MEILRFYILFLLRISSIRPIKKDLAETLLELIYILPYYFYLTHVVYYFYLYGNNLPMYFYSIPQPIVW